MIDDPLALLCVCVVAPLSERKSSGFLGTRGGAGLRSVCLRCGVGCVFAGVASGSCSATGLEVGCSGFWSIDKLFAGWLLVIELELLLAPCHAGGNFLRICVGLLASVSLTVLLPAPAFRSRMVIARDGGGAGLSTLTQSGSLVAEKGFPGRAAFRVYPGPGGPLTCD